ncbi:unnamed protein product [Rotaria sp. Silwood2]|nr:unnamed protein product [Rotaria sp. Silwood2]
MHFNQSHLWVLRRMQTTVQHQIMEIIQQLFQLSSGSCYYRRQNLLLPGRSSSSLFNLHHLGLLCDLLWSDPDNDLNGWGENDAGISFRFGVNIVNEFLNRHNMDLICRAHKIIHSSNKQANEQDDENLKLNCQARSVSDNMINPSMPKMDGSQKCVSWADMNDSASPKE